MSNNPFAKVFRKTFIEDVLNKSLFTNYHNASQQPQRVQSFVHSLNEFLIKNEQPPLNTAPYALDERQLIHYALFLRGYMRDAQDVLKNLTTEQASDKELINLFHASSQYVVACNGKVEGHKNHFSEDETYRFMKVNLSQGLINAEFEEVKEPIDAEKRKLVLFMPFRIKDNENELKKWLYHNMRSSLDNKKVFNNNIDIYVAYFPIEKSRSSKICSTLQTVKNPEHYFEPQDWDFVKNNFSSLLGNNIKFDDKGNFVSGERLEAHKLKSRLKKFNLFGYCAGTADAHRCLTVLKKMSEQIYGPELTKEAMPNIFMMSYGFLPVQKHASYSGAHFFTNESNDQGKKEPFVTMNNPELYEKTRCDTKKKPAKVTVMPDLRNYIIAFKKPQNLAVIEKNERISFVQDAEHGHNISHITAVNLADTFASQQFRTILENACEGKRNQQIFESRDFQNPTNNLMSMQLLAQKNYLIN